MDIYKREIGNCLAVVVFEDFKVFGRQIPHDFSILVSNSGVDWISLVLMTTTSS